MIAIACGLGAAAMWAAATLCSTRSSRLIGAGPVLAWVMLVGLAISLPAAALSDPPENLDGASVAWLALGGCGNVAGLLLEYAAFRRGKVSVVAPIASSEGAVAAFIAFIAGEQIAPGTGALLALIVAGVVLATIAGRTDGDGASADSARASPLALGAAVAFGASLYAIGRASAELPLAWALLPPRIVGTLAIAFPLALTSRLRLAMQALPLVAAAGVAEVAGFALFGLGARESISITAVLGSQFAALAAVCAFVVFQERLAGRQAAGVGAIAAGVAAISALRA